MLSKLSSLYFFSLVIILYNFIKLFVTSYRHAYQTHLVNCLQWKSFNLKHKMFIICTRMSTMVMRNVICMLVLILHVYTGRESHLDHNSRREMLCTPLVCSSLSFIANLDIATCFLGENITSSGEREHTFPPPPSPGKTLLVC